MKYLKVTILFIFLLPCLSLAAFNVDLKYGSTGSEVTELQEFLTDRGYYFGPITGNFYSLTRSAVKKFQEVNDISPAYGYFGPLTRNKINEILSVEEAKEQTQEVQEKGSVSSSIKNDQATSLQKQIDTLLSQIQQLNTQVQNQTKIQEEVRWIQQETKQIQQETKTAVEQINSLGAVQGSSSSSKKPSVPTKFRMAIGGNQWGLEDILSGKANIAVQGQGCSGLSGKIALLNQYGEGMANQAIIVTIPTGSVTATTQPLTQNNFVEFPYEAIYPSAGIKYEKMPGISFWYTPYAKDAAEKIIITSGNLTAEIPITIWPVFTTEEEAKSKSFQREDGKWYLGASGNEFDFETMTCVNNKYPALRVE